jgi:8-oxo-dGTP pyrophosphatase MutT (NUDIX family)
MFKISQIIFQNPNGEYLVYLRDNNPSIPFPNHWDLIGGHVEKGEMPLEALKREVMEELEFELKNFRFWKKYVCLDGDISPNIKYIFHGIIDKPIESIPLNEGQYLRFVTSEEIPTMNFANVMNKILFDFIKENP